MMRSTTLGAAMVAGWLSFVTVVGGLIVLSTAIAGQPPNPYSSAEAGRAYFAHAELTGIYLAAIVTAVTIAVLGLGIRELIGRTRPSTALAGDVGIVLLILAVATYLASGALQLTLVSLAGTDDAAFDGFYRLYAVLYNGAADILEGAWIGAFAIGMLASPLPRALGWLGIVVAASRWVKSLMPFVLLPDELAIISGIPFVLWFGWTVLEITRASRRRDAEVAVAASPA